jgi:hypothetical protein
MVPCLLDATNDITSLQVKVNFAKPNTDSLTLQALIDGDLYSGIAGKTVTLDVGGAQVAFVIDAKGQGINASGTCRFTYSTSKGTGTLNLKLRRGTWQHEWARYGIMNETVLKPGSSVTLPVVIVIGDQALMGEKSLHYTAKKDKSGTAK